MAAPGTTLMAIGTAAVAALCFAGIAAELVSPAARMTPGLLIAAFDAGSDPQLRAQALRVVMLLLAFPLGLGVLLGSADLRPGMAHLVVTLGGIATVALIVATPGASFDLIPAAPSVDLSFDPSTGAPLGGQTITVATDQAARMAALDDLVRRMIAGAYLVLLSPPLAGLGAAVYRVTDRLVFPADPERLGR